MQTVITSATKAEQIQSDVLLKQYQDLIKNIAEMRRLQKAYFSSRDKQTLIWSKNKEAQIDKIISGYKQPTLF